MFVTEGIFPYYDFPVSLVSENQRENSEEDEIKVMEIAEIEKKEIATQKTDSLLGSILEEDEGRRETNATIHRKTPENWLEPRYTRRQAVRFATKAIMKELD